jgi:hypothetical protein
VQNAPADAPIPRPNQSVDGGAQVVDHSPPKRDDRPQLCYRRRSELEFP